MLNAELVNWGALGFGFFDLAAILLFLALAVAFLLKSLQKTCQPVSGVEVWAALLIGWITISYVVHVDISSMSTYAKLVIPPLTYIMLKRLLPDRSAHIRMLFLMLIGFLLPFIMSAVMTYQGEGLGQVVYWTGLERYRGVYANIHNMAHNAGFAIMLAITYLVIRQNETAPLRWIELSVVATVFSVGPYLLYAAQVRNVYLGLAIFFFVVTFFYNKRAFGLFVLLSIVFLSYFWEAVAAIFFDVLDPEFFEEKASRGGRLGMARQALDAWSAAPFLNQLTGMGVIMHGMGQLSGPVFAAVQPWEDPHNDWLYVLMSVGLIGLGIIIGLFASIFRAVLRIRGKEKFALLGVFLAVVLMNVFSNSYITRFSMFQMFFMLMVYADLRSTGSEKYT